MLYRIAYAFARLFRKYPKLPSLIVLALALVALAPLVLVKVYQKWDKHPTRGAVAVSAGTLGESYTTPRYIEQGWSKADSLWFYNTTQGSALLPYDLFIALKTAGSTELLRSNASMDGFRYLPQDKSFFNPDGLPVGFVKEPYQGKDYVGFTCAACHTAQVNFKGAALRIDGGPAMADMVGFLTTLQKSMEHASRGGEAQKAFVADVLRLGNDYASEEAVIADLKKWTATINLYNTVNHSNVDYGPARLDAFGRIYNRVGQHVINKQQLSIALGQVLAWDSREQKRLLTPEQVDRITEGVGDKLVIKDEEFALVFDRLRSTAPGYPGLGLKELLRVRDKIFNVPNAPASYPFLWDIAQSDYVQWNGLANNAALGPLGRNTGEVIGVFAKLDWGRDDAWFGLSAWLKKMSLSAYISGQQKKAEVIDFKSSIDLFNLQRLESHLRSLKSPQWPFCRDAKGEHYLPGDPEDTLEPDAPAYCNASDARFVPEQVRRGELLYNDHCLACHTVIDRTAWDRRVVGKMSSLERILTDPAMAENSLRTSKSGNLKNTIQSVSVGPLFIEDEAPVVQILTATTKGVVATPDADKSFIRRTVDWTYALLMAFTDNDVPASIKSGDYDADTTSRPYASLLAYKARSLNGIWATAPYLHNGSVPTLDALLLPPAQRPKAFKVGAREFDPAKVGFVSEGYEGFNFVTEPRGNKNGGHDYKIEFTPEQRRDLIEFLRTL